MELHNYQKNIANFCATHAHCILSVDMGLGKTASVLHYINWLRPASLLIVAPKRVAETVWLQEAEKWGLEDCATKMVIVAGNAQKRQIKANDDEHPYKIISRDNLKDIEGRYFDVIILDELTSFKTMESQRCKLVRSLKAKRKIGLTGTFLANGAIDIFGQAAAVDIMLSPNFYAWRATNFHDVNKGSGLAWEKWRPNGKLEDILAPIKPNIFTLSAADYLEIPPVTFRTHLVELSTNEMDSYNDMDAFLHFSVGDEIVSVDEKAKFAKAQTLADGFIYSDDSPTGVVAGKEMTKLREVADFVAQCKGENEQVLLFYAFTYEQSFLADCFDALHLKWITPNTRGFLDQWNAGECDVLMAHPASLGHGVNLQYGGRVLVWSTLTYNYELYAQANARLARQGQTRPVFIHHFLAKDTVEVPQLQCLKKKDSEQQSFVTQTKTTTANEAVDSRIYYKDGSLKPTKEWLQDGGDRLFQEMKANGNVRDLMDKLQLKIIGYGKEN